MGVKRSKFSPQFRAEAVRVVIETSRPIADVAREYGLVAQTLGNWVNEYRRSHGGEEPELSVLERAELKRLREENRDLKMEREFLGKVSVDSTGQCNSAASLSAGVSKSWVLRQVAAALQGVRPEQAQQVLLAYEPIWAIGSGGREARAEEVAPVHMAVRDWCVEHLLVPEAVLYRRFRHERQCDGPSSSPRCPGSLRRPGGLGPGRLPRAARDRKSLSMR